MNHRKLQDNDRLREHLASAYVLGTLKGGARRRFEAWIARDAVLAQTVSDWEGRLGPMAEFAPSAPPPARAWQAIEARLGLEARPARTSAWQRLRDSLSFWRGLSLASTAVAAVLLAVLMLQPPASAPAPSSMAMLASANGEPMVAVSANKQQLTVRVVGAVPMAPDRSLELWAIPAQGAPQSLGLIDANGVVTIRMPPNVTPSTMPLLAVSMEPRGGSPNPRAPSGPVMYKGAWMRI
ncbi:anti-sigma factor [Noviherbaspirillum pedocola]|uniref:Anti-sigma factor n=1 Tax=Noviherbaspirillum pedocola TaxID=2801341 RepID=A0A934W8E9_9BURK|nr:anti-sigma factor [Noviherbaspirillum pedocola]MBK4736723.1 anti-sigma factor [Noviherbaspirillum pedocola]